MCLGLGEVCADGAVRGEFHAVCNTIHEEVFVSRRVKIEDIKIHNFYCVSVVIFCSERHRICSPFLSAHLNSHCSALKGSINRGALFYLQSLPSQSFSFCVKRANKRSWHSNTPNPVSFNHSLFFSPHTLLFTHFSLFHLTPIFLLYLYALNSAATLLPSLLAFYFFFSALVYLLFPAVTLCLSFSCLYTLIACLKNMTFFSTSPPLWSCVSLSCMISVSSPSLSLPAQLQSLHTFTPPSQHPALFHTARALAETHTPLSHSLHPPYTPTSPAHWRQRGRKRKRKGSIWLSKIADCHLVLTMHAYHL